MLKEMTIEQHKQSALDILTKVADFCDKNGIRYYIAYGTLIGVIRHKGFIPWDDDIDIWMPRDDYNRFLEIFNSETEHKNLVVIAPTDKISKHTFAKVINTDTVKIESGIVYKNDYLGVDIDVFVLDGQPDDDAVYNAYYDRKMKLYKKYQWVIFDNSKMQIHKRIVVDLYKFYLKFIERFNKHKLDKIINKINSEYSYEGCKCVGSTTSIYHRRSDRFKKEWFEDIVMAEFEGFQFKIPVGYDEILKSLYGDYMQLPPEEERVTHHNNKVYFKVNN